MVEKILASEGLTRHDLGREKFVNRVWEQIFGLGLVEPIDELVDDEAPTEVLEPWADTLRDDSRTGLPIYLRQANGSFVPASRFATRSVSFTLERSAVSTSISASPSR